MEILFRTEKLRKLCSDVNELRRAFGKDGGITISRRLDDLEGAATLLDMRRLPGRCHELTGDRAGQLAVDAKHPFRVIFLPTDDPLPVKPDGGLDWNKVQSIEIIEVVDYHG